MSPQPNAVTLPCLGGRHQCDPDPDCLLVFHHEDDPAAVYVVYACSEHESETIIRLGAGGWVFDYYAFPVTSPCPGLGGGGQPQ